MKKNVVRQTVLSALLLCFVFAVIGCSAPEPVAPTAIPATEAPTADPLTKLEQVQENGVVKCGVYLDYPGLAHIDYDGVYSGLDMDICRAIAVAIFNNADAVAFDGFVMGDVSGALLTDAVDIVMHTPRPQLSIEDPAIGYAQSTFVSGAGMLVGADFEGWSSLNNVPTCALPVGDFEPQLDPLFVADGDQDLDLEYIGEWPRLYERFNIGECKALILPRPMLIEARRQMSAAQPSKILPLTFDLQPVGPIVATRDADWVTLVNSVISCLQSSDSNVSFSTVDLPTTTCEQIQTGVGSYAEIYSRHLGPETQNPLPVAEEIAN